MHARIDHAVRGVLAEVTLCGSGDSFASSYHGRDHDRPFLLDSCPLTSMQSMAQKYSTSTGPKRR